MAALRQGVVNMIREDVDPASGHIIPRKYFSGGMQLFGPALASAYQESRGAGTTHPMLQDKQLQWLQALASPVPDAKETALPPAGEPVILSDIQQNMQEALEGLPVAAMYPLGPDLSLIIGRRPKVIDGEEYLVMKIQRPAKESILAPATDHPSTQDILLNIATGKVITGRLSQDFRTEISETIEVNGRKASPTGPLQLTVTVDGKKFDLPIDPGTFWNNPPSGWDVIRMTMVTDRYDKDSSQSRKFLIGIHIQRADGENELLTNLMEVARRQRADDQEAGRSRQKIKSYSKALFVGEWQATRVFREIDYLKVKRVFLNAVSINNSRYDLTGFGIFTAVFQTLEKQTQASPRFFLEIEHIEERSTRRALLDLLNRDDAVLFWPFILEKFEAVWEHALKKYVKDPKDSPAIKEQAEKMLKDIIERMRVMKEATVIDVDKTWEQAIEEWGTMAQGMVEDEFQQSAKEFLQSIQVDIKMHIHFPESQKYSTLPLGPQRLLNETVKPTTFGRMMEHSGWTAWGLGVFDLPWDWAKQSNPYSQVNREFLVLRAGRAWQGEGAAESSPVNGLAAAPESRPQEMSSPGGIDLNPEQLHLTTSGAPASSPVSADIPSSPILHLYGLTPVIFDILPATNLRSLIQ